VSALITPTAYLVTDAEPETDEWFAARRGGITGTDLSKICGYSKRGNALSVWMDKRGELEDDGSSEAGRWGQLFEEPVAREWATRTDRSIARVGVAANVDEPWMRVSLDRLVGGCGVPCGLEVKTRSAFVQGRWRDGMPDDVLAQVAWARRVTGLDHIHVAVLIGGQELLDLRYDRDDDIESYLLDAARTVWKAVEDGFPPLADPDVDGVLLGLLDRMYAKRAGDRDVDPDQAREWLDQYAAGCDLEKDAKALKTRAKTALVQLLDDGDTALIDGAVTYTYKRPTPGLTLPAAAVKRLRDEQPDIFTALRDEGFITTTEPGPRFELKRNKETS